MTLNAKEWEKTRPTECKGSGIGEACKNWAKFCTSDIEKVAASEKGTSSAIKTIQAFYEAKKTAEGKLTKCKDPKKVNATKILLGKWDTEVKKYQQDLSAETIKTNLEDVIQKRMKVASEKFQANIDSTNDSVTVVAKKLLDEAEVAIKKKDVETSETKLTSGLRKLRDAINFLNKPQDSFNNHVKEAGGIPADRFNLKAFSGEIAKGKKLWTEGNARALKLQKQWDELVDGADVDESKNSKDMDKETKVKIKTVLDLYRVTLADLGKCNEAMKKLLGQAKHVNGNPLLKSNPDGMITVMTKLRKQMDDTQEDAKQVMFDIREGNGKCVKKRKEVFPGAEEGKVIKVFTPFMTRGITINGRLIAAYDSAVDEFKEALQTIIDGGGGAVSDAKKLLGEL